MNKPIYAIWNDNYSTGIEKIDEQHKGVLNLLNKFYTAKLERTDFKTLDSLIDQLKEYGEKHFTYEEELLKTIKYPDIQEHLSFHHNYYIKINILIPEFKLSNGNNIAEILSFLKEWWLSHILNADFKYARFY